MSRFLFVCLGNICRSPAAEAIFHSQVGQLNLSQKISYDSAGTNGYHKGETADPRMTQALHARGYEPISLSRPVEKEDFDTFDYILAMDEQNLADLMRLKPRDSKAHIELICDMTTKHQSVNEIPDPYYGGPEGFDLVIDLLEDAVDGVINKYVAIK